MYTVKIRRGLLVRKETGINSFEISGCHCMYIIISSSCYSIIGNTPSSFKGAHIGLGLEQMTWPRANDLASSK